MATTSSDEQARKRRPQWRGERKAVLVRLPVATAVDLAKVAEAQRRSVSDVATELLTRALSARDVA
jgi:hypothetical protein